jgi:hypothetical protein
VGPKVGRRIRVPHAFRGNVGYMALIIICFACKRAATVRQSCGAIVKFTTRLSVGQWMH